MADVYAVFGTMLSLGIVFPGMLLALRILFPELVQRAETRIGQTPARSFGMGLVGLLIAAVPIAILIALPVGLTKVLGVLMILGSLAVASLGAAGVACVMGSRIRDWTGNERGTMRAFLFGALALEMAAAFPFIGWFLFIPIIIVMSLGAALFALLGWGPAESTEATTGAVPVDAQIQHEPQSA